MSAVRLAILAATEDQGARLTLEKHLVMHRRRERYRAVSADLADVVVVLLSTSLFADDALVEQIRQARDRGAEVIPVRWEACSYKDLFGNTVPAGPRSGWISSTEGGQRAEAWSAVEATLAGIFGAPVAVT